MKFLFTKKKYVITGITVIAATGCILLLSPTKRIDFNTEVKPILNKRCISCHGGVKAKGGFSVLFREEALAKSESGNPVIIPGDPNESEMIRRLTSKDPEERMPYKHEALSKTEIHILKEWIRQGAKWGDHWAYLPVQKTDAPDIANNWIHNDVAKFIYAKLKEEKLQPAAQADKATLLRRVSLDLIGRYPTQTVAEQYLKSNNDKAYEVLVDSLLASPHFGERWASLWLDLARYADTKGYEADGGRSIWKYRDWLIHAFNEDKPYNLFITEQIAGDLLPDPTDAQYIGNTAQSRLAEIAGALPKNDADGAHWWAKLHAVCGRRAAALQELRRAVALGLPPRHLREEDEFAGFASDPGFLAITRMKKG